MFLNNISGSVLELTPNEQTKFQCLLTLTVPLEFVDKMESGTLVAAANVYFKSKNKRYTVFQIVNAFPAQGKGRSKGKADFHLFECTAIPLGVEIVVESGQQKIKVHAADTFPATDADVYVLDKEAMMTVIHQIAPESRLVDNGSRIDIGAHATNSDVAVGLDANTLVRGNVAVVSARPRARTTITNNLISSLLNNKSLPIHIVYFDVNNSGTLSLLNLLDGNDHSSVLCLNDKFIPSNVYSSLKNPRDWQLHKRAALDYLDMMILPSVIEQRRHDFVYGISSLLRTNSITIYRANEQTVNEFMTDTRIDILDGVTEEVEEYIGNLMDGIAETYSGERFGEKNTHEMLDMVDEFIRDSRIHAARRTLNDLRSEIRAIFETYSKDIPPANRRTLKDMVSVLNEDAHSSLTVVQGQKTSDILRFSGNLIQTLIDERLKRLKMRMPVLFIFNNIDEYFQKNGGFNRDAGNERFSDVMQMLLTNGRRHGLGFCLTLEHASAIDRPLARKINSYFIGPITFSDEPPVIADMLNVSEDLLKPAVNYEDGRFLYTSSDSPYHRRVPIPVATVRNTDILHAYLDNLVSEQKKLKQEYEDRSQRSGKDKDERKPRRSRDRTTEKGESGDESYPPPEPKEEEQWKDAKKPADSDSRSLEESFVEDTGKEEHADEQPVKSTRKRKPSAARTRGTRSRTGKSKTGQSAPGTTEGENKPDTKDKEDSGKQQEKRTMTFESRRSGGYSKESTEHLDMENVETFTPSEPADREESKQKSRSQKKPARKPASRRSKSPKKSSGEKDES